ncbi:MAG: phage minor head protein [Limisphaerales bacterium]
MISADATKPKLLTRIQTRKQQRLAREKFARARRAEIAYERQLKRVAKEVGDIIKAQAPGGNPKKADTISRILGRYAELLRPWARRVSERMVAEVSKRDAHAWNETGKRMGRALQEEVRNAPTGAAAAKIMNEQVNLITSLPLEAAQRVQKLALQGLAGPQQYSRIIKEVMRSGEVTKGRAKLIARTETGRAASAFTQARAQFIGSEGYIWRTMRDQLVRDEHRELEGQYVRWTHPPIAGPKGERYHAGAGPNCRCYSEPVLPERV